MNHETSMGTSFCLLKKFLGCLELRTGLQINVFLTLIIYTVLALVGVFILEKHRQEFREGHSENAEESYWRRDHLGHKTVTVSVICVLDVAANVCLFLACRYGNKWLVWPYLVYRIPFLLVALILWCGQIAKLFGGDGEQVFGNAVSTVAWFSGGFLIAIGVYIYFATVSFLAHLTSANAIKHIRVVPVGPALYGELPPAYSEKPPDYQEMAGRTSDLTQQDRRHSQMSHGGMTIFEAEVLNPPEMTPFPHRRQTITSIA